MAELLSLYLLFIDNVGTSDNHLAAYAYTKINVLCAQEQVVEVQEKSCVLSDALEHIAINQFPSI